MSSPEYYERNKDKWKDVYYPRFVEKLRASPTMQVTKRQRNRECERRSSVAKSQRSLDNRFMFIRQLGGKCEICGFADHRSLQFDHIDPSKKTMNLPGFFRLKNLARAFTELHNCRLLCANCHAISTYESGRLRIGRTRVEA